MFNNQFYDIEKFFTSEFIAKKKVENFLQSISLKKISQNFL